MLINAEALLFSPVCLDQSHHRDVEYTVTLCPECHKLAPARDARDAGQCFTPVARFATQRVGHGHWHRHARETEVAEHTHGTRVDINDRPAHGCLATAIGVGPQLTTWANRCSTVGIAANAALVAVRLALSRASADPRFICLIAPVWRMALRARVLPAHTDRVRRIRNAKAGEEWPAETTRAHSICLERDVGTAWPVVAVGEDAPT